ncbi:hypothetical protein [Acidisphaera rubrifaciens]|uniref:Secreted protein n=1 Tax=Acidisphaera rubrifaciens HS-AP3 TaxID=1231350 RepID=A0A0D6P726_9PROT|nr:hypothetical protein [Acidisphaera rubrifaciens]GAN77580.1 hypothetical protein Asru_0384_02 [Acidisphaera rubrifaciens HS-AP3]
MTTFLTARRLGAIAAIAAALGATAASPAARADVLFHNTTGQTVYFGVSCNGTGTDQWSVAPFATRRVVCENGAAAMRVYLPTDTARGEAAVRATAWDGRSYDLGYDGGGDIGIVPRG